MRVLEGVALEDGALLTERWVDSWPGDDLHWMMDEDEESLGLAFDPNQPRDEIGRWKDVEAPKADVEALAKKLFLREYGSEARFFLEAKDDGMTRLQAKKLMRQDLKWFRDLAEARLSGVTGRRFDSSKRWASALSDADLETMDKWFSTKYTVLRELDQRGKMTPQLKAVLAVVASAPRYRGVAYRGLTLSPEELKKLRPGRRVGIKGISSFSTDRRVADEFTWPLPQGHVRVILKARVKDGRDLRGGATAEKEIVVRRENFRVKSVKAVVGKHVLKIDKPGHGDTTYYVELH